jgi:hypothetical protein
MRKLQKIKSLGTLRYPTIKVLGDTANDEIQIEIGTVGRKVKVMSSLWIASELIDAAKRIAYIQKNDTDREISTLQSLMHITGATEQDFADMKAYDLRMAQQLRDREAKR